MMKRDNIDPLNNTNNAGAINTQKVRVDSSSYPAFRVEGCETAYRDFLYATVQEIKEQWQPPKDLRKGPRGGVTEPFPMKLYKMLVGAEEEGFSHIVSWQPHGRCFLIREPKAFEKEVIPKYFSQTKLTSFQRQMNLYGFKRVLSGPDQGGQYNPLFIRGRPDICSIIRRTHLKGGAEAIVPADMRVEESLSKPSFYALDTCPSASSSDFVSQSNGDTTSKTGKIAPLQQCGSSSFNHQEGNKIKRSESHETSTSTSVDIFSDRDLFEVLDTNSSHESLNGPQINAQYMAAEASTDSSSFLQNQPNMMQINNFSNLFPNIVPQTMVQAAPMVPTSMVMINVPMQQQMLSYFPMAQNCQGTQHNGNTSQTSQQGEMNLIDALESGMYGQHQSH